MSTRTIAGDCLVRSDGVRERRIRGHVLAIVKPDDTVLVHDVDGYQPVAWLTRPESLSITEDPPWLVAIDGDEMLQVEAVGDVTVTEHDTTPAGIPVGSCRCGGTLVRTRGTVVCLDCDDSFPLPPGSTVLEDVSPCDCGLPRMRVERGEPFDLCIDRSCESLDDRVAERFDGVWTCPECGSDLQILRRGGLLAGCVRYPDCETGFSIPAGVVDGDCACGLPWFETATGGRCLDASCSEGRP